VFSSFHADTVESITPDKVRGLRDLLNSSAMDIMYYTSPLYRDEVKHILPFISSYIVIIFSRSRSGKKCIFSVKNTSKMGTKLCD